MAIIVANNELGTIMNFNFMNRLSGFLYYGLILRFTTNKLIKSFNLKGNEKILELGSNAGHVSKILLNYLSADKEGMLTCTDISEDWMNLTRRRLKNFDNVKFFVGNILDLEDNKGSYDWIFIRFTLHEVTKSIHAPMMKKFGDLLKTGGKIYIQEPTKDSHGISVIEIKKLMMNAGLTEIRSTLKKNSYSGVFKKEKHT